MRGWSRGLQLFLVLSAAICIVAKPGVLYWRHTGTTNDAKLTLVFEGVPYFDFTIFREAFQHFRTVAFYAPYRDHLPYGYPALCGVLLALFYLPFSHPQQVFFTVSLLIPLAAAIVFAVALARCGMRPLLAALVVLLALPMSYPFQFEWNRSNIEVVLFLFAVFAVAAYWRRWYWVAALLIGVDVAAKLYPVVLLGLLLAKRRYKEAAAGLLVAVGLNALSLWILGPTYAVASEMVRAGVLYFRVHYILSYKSLAYDHSLVGLGKRLALWMGAGSGVQDGRWLTAYLAAAALVGLALYFGRIVRLPRTNQVIALVVLIVLLPPVSYDYTLMHLYIGWAVLVLYAQRCGQTPKPVLWMFALFAVLLSPEGSLYVLGDPVAAQLKALAMLALLAVVLCCPLREPWLEQDGRQGDSRDEAVAVLAQ